MITWGVTHLSHYRNARFVLFGSVQVRYRRHIFKYDLFNSNFLRKCTCVEVNTYRRAAPSSGTDLVQDRCRREGSPTILKWSLQCKCTFVKNRSQKRTFGIAPLFMSSARKKTSLKILLLSTGTASNCVGK